tara:strand:+ start:2774 stop:2959 length:186 start_codon:yes stop_codon:yes gene_type:complete
MSKESEIKNLLTQIRQKAIFDDEALGSQARLGSSGKSFMVFHLEVLQQLIDEHFQTNRTGV